VGAWLSKFVGARLVHRFVDLQCAIAVLGGTSAAVLFLAFASGRVPARAVRGDPLGTPGPRDPALLRILKDEMDFKDLSRVLTFDYVGSL
jgi:spermidine synthase